MKAIVEDFNVAYAHWAGSNGVVANFVWGYEPGSGIKTMVISEIDRHIYRKSAPSAVDVRAALDKVNS